jgi:hypothetical protein
VALAALNAERGLESAMPSVQHMDPLVGLIDRSTLTPAKLDSLTAIVSGRRRLTALIARIQRVLLRVRWQVAEAPELAVATAPTGASPDLPVAAIAATWTGGSRVMHELLSARGAAYLHFLQPNQYATRRRFADDEAAIALNDASPYKNSVAYAYPALAAAARSDLSSRGVRFFDATGVFDNEPAAVYMDNCCHDTRVGNHRLADFVAAAILASPGPWQ